MRNLLRKTKNEPSTFKTKIWVEINYGSRGTCKTSNQIKFKTSMIMWNLCDYTHAYILVSRTIAITDVPLQ